MERSAMRTYVIVRRNGWQSADELQKMTIRSTGECERMSEDLRWLRSYVLAETDGSLGTVCIYQASSPEAIRRHARRRCRSTRSWPSPTPSFCNPTRPRCRPRAREMTELGQTRNRVSG
jgi:hypothetical protein